MNTKDLSQCTTRHVSLQSRTRETLTKRHIVSDREDSTIENHDFIDCVFDGLDISGITFSNCTFARCSFDRTTICDTSFSYGKFSDCDFKRSSWIHVRFDELNFENCSFTDVDIEANSFTQCRFENIAWNAGSLIGATFGYCILINLAFAELVICGIFLDCQICGGAFSHVIERDSSIVICSSPAQSSAAAQPEPGESKDGDQAVSGTTQASFDPLSSFEIDRKHPTLHQLQELDHLLLTEKDERYFQRFLERNRELLAVGVKLGHHGIYVISQVRFGKRHVADFMIGAKNSMGHFWTGLEIESPRHKITKRDGHLTQKVQHAIDQVREWKTFIRNNRATVQRPRSQQGEGLIGIEPDFPAWIIVGRDRENASSAERRAVFLDSNQNIHVQTWDGFRDRIAATLKNTAG